MLCLPSYGFYLGLIFFRKIPLTLKWGVGEVFPLHLIYGE